MTLNELSDVSQTIAAVAVVVSLVYLAIQTRQAARNAKAAIHENRAATIVGHIDQMMDSEFHPVWNRGNAATPDMSDADIGRYTIFVGGLVVIWEERFRQREEVFHIGSRTFSTSVTSIVFTGRSPNTGYAYVSSVALHWAACLALRQPARWASM